VQARFILLGAIGLVVIGLVVGVYQAVPLWHDMLRGVPIGNVGMGQSSLDRLIAVVVPLVPLGMTVYALRRWSLKCRGTALVAVSGSILWAVFYVTTVAMMYYNSETWPPGETVENVDIH
jgi:hypothetical protein